MQQPAGTELQHLYRHRFQVDTLPAKRKIWEVLCRDFFGRLVPPDSVVLDLACGYGEFINEISAASKYGVDINPDTQEYLDRNVQFIKAPASEIPLESATIDIVFTSNFFEHLPSKETLDRVLKEVLRILKPGGSLIAMGPNIRFVPGAYWDFYDHQLALSDRSLAEGLSMNGYEVTRVVPKFLPYTTRSTLPQHPLLVAAYLRVPIVWSVLGKQFLVTARKPLNPS